MRLFIAINLPKKEKKRIHRAVRPIREQDLPVKWVDPDDFHLTLKFLGRVKKEAVDSVRECMDGVAGETEGFDVEIGGFGAFPTIRSPRVLWVGVEATPALRCLKQDLEWALGDHGFEAETRAFHPHLTMGRVRKGTQAGRFRGVDELAASMDYSGELKVRRIDLMQSQTTSSGARYSKLYTASLRVPATR